MSRYCITLHIIFSLTVLFENVTGVGSHIHDTMGLIVQSTQRIQIIRAKNSTLNRLLNPSDTAQQQQLFTGSYTIHVQKPKAYRQLMTAFMDTNSQYNTYALGNPWLFDSGGCNHMTPKGDGFCL